MGKKLIEEKNKDEIIETDKGYLILYTISKRYGRLVKKDLVN